jgi:Spy/CpxP family protein refolding chaperone
MKLTSGTPRRMRALAGMLLLAVFVAGALAGAAVFHTATARAETTSWTPRFGGVDGQRGPRGAPDPVQMSAMLGQRLSLTDAQEAEVRDILERSQRGSEEILAEIQPRLRARMEATDTEIRSVLDESQREEFDRFNAERREMMTRRAGSHPVRERGRGNVDR